MTLVHDDLRHLLEIHGGEWTQQVKCCTACGRLYTGWADGAACPDCDDGTLQPVARFIDEGPEAEA